VTATVPALDGQEAARDVLGFIGASPSPFHACATAAARLEQAGFTGVDETGPWPADGRHYVVRAGSLVAWQAPPGLAPAAPFTIVGAHTDSPNLRVRPRPDLSRAGVRQLGVEVYGGVLLNSWLDRDLGLSGRVALRSASGIEARLVLADRPLLRVPQLAIHLDREITSDGLRLNPQVHLVPLWGLGATDEGGFRRFLAAELDVEPADVLGWEVMAHDVAPGTLVGPANELLSSPRLDNLCSCWAAITALVATASVSAGSVAAGSVRVVALFDHEEVGSHSTSGAGGPLLATVLERIALARGAERDDWHRSRAGSVCVSADGAHATHPNYAERHDPAHQIAFGGGPVVKHNASQRYATGALGAARFVAACERAGVPVQHYSHRNDLPCGSTIGPITAARLGIDTVDVGAPQLAMHSARELMGAADPGLLARALTEFYADHGH